ncbi:papain-like cysteine protease family protein [Allorhizocola rhizosphaerae]|uniref:papain-like cysteine protease family protein n=1 Tax=Allorhizocola rhizosphaerae TaxID=1872709 RepID=UPI0013C2A957|nr:papain-like cysteine protease family protein [Allorhizocola rhizosphaerae]
MNELRRHPARILAVLMVSLGLAIAAPQAAIAAEKNLSVTAYQQEKSNWCWAAASKMIIKYKTGRTVSQCQIVKDGKHISTCPNQAGTRANVMSALSQNGVNSGSQVDLTWAQMKNEIDSSRPIYSGIVWRSNGAGHAHVIRGYYSTGYSTGVSYIDPATGSRTAREWANYKDNSSWNASTALIYLYKL